MLTELRVRDLGVIEDLTVELGPGMTALSGETGAGKTLVVEALGLALGGRAAAGLVRAGSAEAVVEARFVLPDPSADDGEREVVLVRSVPAAGRSRAWVDGRPAPVSALGEAAGDLVDIHGQHDQQSLLDPAVQRAALDAFGRVDLSPLVTARRVLGTIDKRMAALGGDEHQRAREIDVLGHQVAEIAAAVITGEDEEAALADEEARLADLSAHREAAAEALAALEGGDGSGEGAALELLGRAAGALGGRTPFADWEVRLRAASAELGDVASDLRRVVETWEDDPGRLDEVQARRRRLADLRRKYGGSLAEVAVFGAEAARRLEALEGAERDAMALGAERTHAERALREAEAAVLSARREAAPNLARAAGERLRDLAMPGARFEVAVDGPAGESVRLLLGANPGEPVQPLSKVASGGELARAMLALRLVTLGGPSTMVFDEVDAGVGGAAALSLGRALREVADGRQVVVVTHLAQVAAAADRQIAIHKDARGGRTVTGAAVLSADQRLVELSRMLSGHPDSATARAHAEELLASAQRRAPSTTVGGAGG